MIANKHKRKDRVVKPGFEHVGRRIKEERLRSGLTLSELAKAVGVSISYISLVENAKSVPSLKILDRICTRLSIHLSNLFSEEERRTPRGFSVFRRQNHVVVDVTDKRTLRFLLPKTELPVEPVQLRILPGEERGSFSSHKGIEFGYIVRGEVEFTVRDQAGVVCGEGDSIIYDAGLPHLFVNWGGVEAELLVVGLSNLALSEGLQNPGRKP
jgi:transcriptional regulator with XRE-family HTH domain